MKTYNDYYDIFSKECWTNIKKNEKLNGERWWDKNTIDDSVNDCPIIENKTGVNSSEYVILHDMLCQMIIDYITEHPLNNEVSTYSIEINLLSGEWKVYFNNIEDIIFLTHDNEENLSFKTYAGVENEHVINSYDELNERIYFFISDFIRRHRENINVKFTSILFSMVDMDKSLQEKKWTADMDSSLSFYVGDELVVCSM